MWYLFHGTDEFSAREALEALRAESDYGYNQDIFKGAEASLADLIGACETFPFLSDQRLVVLEGLPKKSASRKAKDAPSGSQAAEASAATASEGQQGEGQGAARKKAARRVAQPAPTLRPSSPDWPRFCQTCQKPRPW
ncbi:MAG TPA: hypothetical protein VFU32_05670 [Ktedonobacterales bacterium]|nr:hypothetical protein [Ktedonobacterales bacterium]